MIPFVKNKCFDRVLGLFCLSVVAGSLANAIESAIVLPKGIYRARIVTAVTGEIDEKINSSGRIEGVTEGFNKSLTMKDLAKSISNPQKRADAQKLLSALDGVQPGLSDQLVGVNLYSNYSLRVTQTVPALEYGINNRWTLGLRVPVVQRRVKMSLSAQTVNNSEAISKMMGKIQPDQIAKGLKALESQALNTAYFQEAILTNKGYVAPENFDHTDLGDVEVGARYQFLKNADWLASTQLGVRLPTGQVTPLDNPFDPGSGEGFWTAGWYFMQEWKVNKWFSLNTAQKTEWSLPDHRRRAVPKDSDDKLPSLLPEDGQVQRVTRRRPLDLELQAAATGYFWEKTVTTWAGFLHKIRGEDQYTGPGGLDYASMGRDTDIESTGSEIGVGYSTIPAYRRGQMSLPMEIKAQFNRTFRGKNVPLVSYGRMDVMVYF